MGKEWLIRDPIHGFIEPTDQEINLIDHPYFQRLRGIKQLVNTHFVFPGATHTRFEHSIGTMHVASKIVNRIPSLKNDDNKVRVIRLAALLHDLGHGPFSHVSEEIVSRLTHDEDFKNIQITTDVLSADEGIRGILEEDVDSVIDLLNRGDNQSVEYDILDGALDADKHDYILRDAYYTGVPYGRPDTLRVLYTLREIKQGNSNESYLGVSEKGIEAVQSIHIARYNMLRVVHFHKTRRAADLMVIRATLLAATSDNTIDENLFKYSREDADFLRRYYEIDDRCLIRMLLDGRGVSQDIAQRVQNRRLFKCAYMVDIEDFQGIPKRDGLLLNQEGAAKIEDEIASTIGIDKNYVIIDKQGVENPLYREPAGQAAAAIRQILIDCTSAPRFLYEMPGPWGSDQKLALNRIVVYCSEENVPKAREIAQQIITGSREGPSPTPR